MDNPNVASGTSSTPQFLDTVPAKATVVMGQTCPDHPTAQSIGTTYMDANSEAASGTTYRFGMQGTIAAQPAMTPQGALPSFEKLAPKAMSTAPGPMGTDYIK